LLATQGYGSYSVDAVLGIHERVSPAVGWLALAGGVTAAMAVLSQRRETLKPDTRQQQQPSSETAETETPATVS
jgi:hypothetical protein